MRRSLVAGLIAAAVVALPSLLASAEPTSSWRSRAVQVADVSFDVVLLRPVQLIAVVVGSALFLPAGVVTAPGGWDSIKEAWSVFVATPWQDGITRPLGEF